MQRAIQINRASNAAALNYLGYTYAEMGTRLDETESLVRRALAIEPTRPSTSTASAGCTTSAATSRAPASTSSERGGLAGTTPP
jgi:hypothetical protein